MPIPQPQPEPSRASSSPIGASTTAGQQSPRISPRQRRKYAREDRKRAKAEAKKYRAKQKARRVADEKYAKAAIEAFDFFCKKNEIRFQYQKDSIGTFLNKWRPGKHFIGTREWLKPILVGTLDERFSRFQSTIERSLRRCKRFSSHILRSLLSKVIAIHNPITLSRWLDKDATQKINQFGSFVEKSGNRRTPDCASVMLVESEVPSGTVIACNSNEYGVQYLAFHTRLFNPSDLQAVISGLGRALRTACDNADPVLIFDGDRQEICYKRVLRRNVVIRTRAAGGDRILDNMAELVECAPLSAEDTTILNAIPASREEMSAAHLDPTDWDIWKQEFPDWNRVGGKQGFSVQRCSSATILDALQASKNVIVLIAHAETGELYFPDPRPAGSTVSPEDIRNVRSGIEKNRPNVYLFCCEVADTKVVESITTALLECGAGCVVAPQTKVETRRSFKLFCRFLRRATKMNPALAFVKAERLSWYRKYETWVG